MRILKGKQKSRANLNNNKYIWDNDLLLKALINRRIYHNRYKTQKLNFQESSPEIYLTLLTLVLINLIKLKTITKLN